MAREHTGRAHRLEQYPRRGEDERARHEREHEDRPYYDDETRPNERRHWRGDDYDDDDEFERGRSYYADDRDRERLLGFEHRRSLLRGREEGERYGRRDELRPYRWGGHEAYRDDDRGGVGPYVGRGPKGYRRSDDRILEEICERLTDHPSIDASDIEVRVAEGDVTLTGRVESRTVKHLTENMVETVSGVKEVHNQLRIAPPANLADDWQEPRERRSADPGASKTRRR
jgi:hypothetical protein